MTLTPVDIGKLIQELENNEKSAKTPVEKLKNFIDRELKSKAYWGQIVQVNFDGRQFPPIPKGAVLKQIIKDYTEAGWFVRYAPPTDKSVLFPFLLIAYPDNYESAGEKK